MYHARRIVTVVAVATAAVTILSLFGRLIWLFELFTHFRVQLGAGVAVFAVVAVGLRMMRSALVLVAIAVANLGLTLSYVVPSGAAADTTPATFRIMSVNVSRNNIEYAALHRLIEDSNPDIVGLIEVDIGWVESMARFNTAYPYRITRSEAGYYGLAILSRFPLRELAGSPLTHDGTQTALISEVSLADRTSRFILTHLRTPLTPTLARARNAQIRKLAGLLGNGRGMSRILCGDLNITPWSPHYVSLEGDTNMTNAAKGAGYYPTWPTRPAIMRIPIDHCLVSDEFAVTQLRTGPEIGSDHLPLTVDLGFK